ncbi:NAD(P)-dependent oxidoreductase [Fodinicola acaciae]|uniref:NAD(P)-dependent oxidoreductase n=1 Tax=Fodinicola acaciae TaxID=2681555 RepID=UPI0013CF607A|nr:SDR family oxidoreductase [Fodinicola acaciae]
MKLTVVAATGGVGKHVLEQAIAAGHDVTVVARNPSKLPMDIRTVQADLRTTAPDVDGADAVLSCLGATTNAEAGIASAGTRKIVEAMRIAGVRRLIAISASPISTMPSPNRPHPPRHDPGDGLFVRYFGAPLVKAMFRKQYADLAVMEDVLRDSGLDWTAIRPPRLVDKPVTGRYRVAVGENLPGGLAISRADLAHCMLSLVDRTETFQRTVGVAY